MTKEQAQRWSLWERDTLNLLEARTREILPDVLEAMSLSTDDELFDMDEALFVVLGPAQELAEKIGKHLERMYTDGYETCSEEIGIDQPVRAFVVPSSLEEDLVSVFIEDVENLTYRVDLIARTTGMQALNDGRLDAITDANAALQKEATGRRIGKKWNAMMDDDTRFTHFLLDGTVVEADGWFETVNGRAQRPGGFNIPEEDCNCRCVIDPVEMEVER